MSTYAYDYLVIGGGSGGVSSARRAAGYQAKVAIVEGSRMGGTCVNVGCVPKKIMYNASTLRETLLHEASHYTLPTNKTTVDWNKLKNKRDAYIARLNKIYQSNLEKSDVTIYNGWAKLVDEHTVEIKLNDGTSTTVSAAHILIATGGEPMVPSDLKGKEHTITSDGFFELESCPKKVVVVGAGYIAVELAGVLNGLGSETHLVVRKQKALRNFDVEVSDFLDNEMGESGIIIHRNTDGVEKVELHGRKKKVICKNGAFVDDADVVLMAAGRSPKVDGLGLDQVDLKLDDKSECIVVDEYQTTSVPNIYALGDVCGQVELTPMAIAAGRRLADRLFGGMKEAKVSYELVPTVVFSHPPMASIGLTEEQAVEKYGGDNLHVYKSTFVNLFYSMYDMEPDDKPKSFYKIICAGDEEQVVGLHLIGKDSDEILQGFGVAMKMGATKADFDACVALHPTAAEELVTMGDWGKSPHASGAKNPPLLGAAPSKPSLQKSKM